jgi:putative PIN family toxin of toxin-antitoxin system
MTKTVFDTNIWISYFIKGNTAGLIDLVVNNNVKFMSSGALYLELEKVITRSKFKKYFPDGTDKYLNFFYFITENITTFSSFNQCADVNDNYLFDLAYQSYSKYLVSGDKKVLETPVRNSLSVITLRKFKDEIKN